MKHLKLKTKLFQRAALTMLLAVAGITNLSADGNFLGHSAIQVNDTWYRTDDWHQDWCTGGLFGANPLGTITSLKIGGQSQVWEQGNSNWNGGGVVHMYCQIDNGEERDIPLYWIQYKDETHNNIFESRDENDKTKFVNYNIDISNLSPGTHTISIWFKVVIQNNDVYDSNNSNNYTTTFTISALNAKEGQDNLYWSTFYRNDANFEIGDEENACAYTASVNGTAITLHKLGKVIPQGTAVIIVGEDASISMTAVESTTVQVPSNNLAGVAARTKCTEIEGSGTFYVLGNGSDGFGFRQYSGEYMPAHKAFLRIASSARGFTIEFEDDGTTGIRTINNASIDNGNWYSLDGRKFSSKPSQRGVYINNGKKVIIK